MSLVKKDFYLNKVNEDLVHHSEKTFAQEIFVNYINIIKIIL